MGGSVSLHAYWNCACVMLAPLAPVNSEMDASAAAITVRVPGLAVQASWHEIPEANTLHAVCHYPTNAATVV